jgi:ribosomal protein L29
MSEDKKSLLESIRLKKRNFIVMKLKIATGEAVAIKDIRNSRKEIARLFTKLNAIKA